MTDTFRALCQELIDEIDAKAYGVKSLPSSVAIDRARAALAQPEPQGPTDEELMALAVAMFEDPFSTDKDYARIARLLNELAAVPAIEPVPGVGGGND